MATEPTECLICIEPYSKKRKAVKCQYCPSNACSGCQQRYLLQTYEDPHCMDCKRGWSTEFMADNFPLLFRNNVLRKHRRKILFEREKAGLPAFQIYVQHKKESNTLNARINEIKKVFGKMYYGAAEPDDGTLNWKYQNLQEICNPLRVKRKFLSGKIDALLAEKELCEKEGRAFPLESTERLKEFQQKREKVKGEIKPLKEKLEEIRPQWNKMRDELLHLQNNRWRAEMQYEDRWVAGGAAEATSAKKEEAKEFIMKCPDDGCRGFLSSAYKCGTCSKWSCSKCMAVIGLEKSEDHVCDKDAVETAKMIKKETKPCPKCGTRIYKLDGCFAENTPILMWDGSTKMSQNIIIGDKLVGDDGTIRIVQELCSGSDTLYTIEQGNGISYTVNSKHKLALKYCGHKRIYWASSINAWKAIWFDRDTFSQKSKMIKVTDTNTKDESYKQLSEYLNSIPEDDVFEITVDEYMRLSDNVKRNLMGFKICTKGIEWPEIAVDLEPYIVGLYLGDGIHTGLSFAINTEKDPEIMEYLLSWCKNNNAEIVHGDKYKFDIRRRGNRLSRNAIGHGATSIDCKACKKIYCSFCDLPDTAYINDCIVQKKNPLKNALEKYNLIKNKHIPNEYLTNSRQVRLELLAGLIDTDGFVSNNGKRITISQANHSLAKDIEKLSLSLGFHVTVRKIEKNGVPFPGKEKRDYGTHISLNISGEKLGDIPCKIARKRCSNTTPNKDWSRTSINVIPVGEGTYYGWSITGNKRFVLNDMTVVRNCDQMWCVMDGCHTAFSWETGKVVTGVVHNPHYYEWIRRNGGGQMQRNLTDIPCGGIPTIWQMNNNIFRNKSIPAAAFNRIMNIHRRMVEHLDVRLPTFPARAPANANKDANVAYLMNMLDEEQWKRKLELTEASYKRKREVGQILSMAITAGSDILRRGLQQEGTNEVKAATIVDVILPELDRLRDFVNDSFKALAKREHMAVPQLGTDWEWNPLRALYRGASGSGSTASPKRKSARTTTVSTASMAEPEAEGVED